MSGQLFMELFRTQVIETGQDSEYEENACFFNNSFLPPRVHRKCREEMFEIYRLLVFGGYTNRMDYQPGRKKSDPELPGTMKGASRFIGVKSGKNFHFDSIIPMPYGGARFEYITIHEYRVRLMETINKCIHLCVSLTCCVNFGCVFAAVWESGKDPHNHWDISKRLRLPSSNVVSDAQNENTSFRHKRVYTSTRIAARKIFARGACAKNSAWTGMGAVARFLEIAIVILREQRQELKCEECSGLVDDSEPFVPPSESVCVCVFVFDKDN